MRAAGEVRAGAIPCLLLCLRRGELIFPWEAAEGCGRLLGCSDRRSGWVSLPSPGRDCVELEAVKCYSAPS